MDSSPPPPRDPTRIEPDDLDDYEEGPLPPEQDEWHEEPAAPPSRRWSPFALGAFALAVLAAGTGALAAFGSRSGVWHYRVGFQVLEWAAYGGIAAAVLAILAMVLTRGDSGRKGFFVALFALVLGVLVAFIPWNAQRTARSAPPIHDITTDLENPPEFAALVPRRDDSPIPVEYGGPQVAAQQRRAYPDIRPLILDLPVERAFQRALDTAVGMGWEIVAASASAGRIEATDRTFWFGFHDDVVVRLTPLDSRTVIDVRSLSREGESSARSNADRVRSYLEAVQR